MSRILLILLNILVLSSSYIVIFWGRPADYTGVTRNSAENYTACCEACANLTNCSAIYFYRSCYLYAIEILNNTKTEIAGFKSGGIISSCPSSMKTIYYSKNYTFSSDGTFWNITGPCPRDWYLSARSNADWCMQVFDGKAINYSSSVTYCEKNYAAVLSGVSTAKERTYVLDKSHKLYTGAQKTVIIDGLLNNNCTVLMSQKNKNGTCSWPKSYFFNDKYITNYNYYTWTDPNPDAHYSNGEYQQAIIMYSFNGQPQDGIFDDTMLSENAEMLVCGKLATIVGE